MSRLYLEATLAVLAYDLRYRYEFLEIRTSAHRLRLTLHGRTWRIP